MKIEFIKIKKSDFWHLTSKDGNRVFCKKLYLPWTGLVIAVIRSDHYPEMMCNRCREKKSEDGTPLFKETTFATYNY